ncbi:MAG: hypothetical protein IPM24_20065 [Bryobacterales bacterium]|nr:hypothetical protein [Bryobacterales bacterium]
MGPSVQATSAVVAQAACGAVEFWERSRNQMLKAAAAQLVPETAEDFTIAFEDSLRELDGNFIATNRYQGGLNGRVRSTLFSFRIRP